MKLEEFEKMFLAKRETIQLPFHKWHDIFNSSPSNSGIENLALTRMGETASTLIEWQKVSFSSSSDSELKKLALKKIEELLKQD